MGDDGGGQRGGEGKWWPGQEVAEADVARRKRACMHSRKLSRSSDEKASSTGRRRKPPIVSLIIRERRAVARSAPAPAAAEMPSSAVAAA